MTARPMTLETALRYQGYTIDALEVTDTTITTDLGVIVRPAAILSKLTWQRGTPPSGQNPALGDDLYLGSLPIFDAGYRPYLVSSILDMFRTRRLGYNTPGEFRLAVRRWGNLNMPLFNQRYASTAVVMPLDELAVTDHVLDVSSDFPQSEISGSGDYATASNDRRSAENGRRRSIAELLEIQRAAYLNVDVEVIDSMDSLFLGAFDGGERDSDYYGSPPRLGYAVAPANPSPDFPNYAPFG